MVALLQPADISRLRQQLQRQFDMLMGILQKHVEQVQQQLPEQRQRKGLAASGEPVATREESTVSTGEISAQENLQVQQQELQGRNELALERKAAAGGAPESANGRGNEASQRLGLEQLMRVGQVLLDAAEVPTGATAHATDRIGELQRMVLKLMD
jgi:hypothetical protein